LSFDENTLAFFSLAIVWATFSQTWAIFSQSSGHPGGHHSLLTFITIVCVKTFFFATTIKARVFDPKHLLQASLVSQVVGHQNFLHSCGRTRKY
jgi:hypothetical protein